MFVLQVHGPTIGKGHLGHNMSNTNNRNKENYKEKLAQIHKLEHKGFTWFEF